ncbi:serine protease AprX [Geodermatophilus normandii]|uniref:Serine protease AprX n=1 Tax=Geodermatophilus normandii TaxID=1137989 RepID=A0A317QTC8_9ACTN|nr:S8 family serine peptidase [Geodermatophilus normandii]PWW24990.1 serine protease AprX [Geodermatophilus normandii]
MSRLWARSTSRMVATVAAATAVLGGMVAGAGPAGADPLGYDPNAKGALAHIAQAVGAHDSYRAGYTGRGVGVALIDTGVTRVPGLDSGNVVDGVDLSFDSQDPELAHRDAYGHGTHLASIIAGRDVPGSPASYTDPSRFTGIAPDSTLVNVKVGASDGAVDVTQVIAAIDWVVEHRNDNGMNIRVINLSYGTDSTQDSRVDPLAFAVEQAWKAGIVVVVAGGNDGSTNYNLANPARDPYVLAVGAADTQGTVSAVDDTVPAWATRGTNQRHVDVVAPGVSVVGLRVPNGYADERHADARRGARFAVSSGTSQAAAVVSGEVALLLQEDPRLTPDQVKRQIMATATAFSSTTNQYRGNGLTDVRQAQVKPNAAATQSSQFWSTGTGSVEASRGTSHVDHDGVLLQGEIDVFGNAWDGRAWAAASARQTVWAGGTWRGHLLSGDGWDGTTWRTAEWTQPAWDTRQWRDASWSTRQWRDGSWVTTTWSTRQWRDASWSTRQWRTADLASAAWG